MPDIKQFETERLILRGVTEADIPCYQKHFADYEIIRHLTKSAPWPYPEDGAERFLKDVILPRQGNDRWMWGIFLKENPAELIGAIELWREGKPEHRGFWLARKHHSKGIMTEAVAPITQYAFEELGFDKIVYANAVGNTASRRVKEKAGATFLYTEPAEFVDPQYTEHEVWELTKENWLKNRS
mgnify:CR=1 FL=1